MSKDEYYVEPDGDGDLTLWVDDTPIVATLENGGLFVQDSHPRHERAVWRAAVSVLAPDNEVIEALAQVLHSHAGRSGAPAQFLYQATEILGALRDRAVSG